MPDIQKNDPIYYLAECAHATWAHWMRYFFTQCKEGKNGKLIVPAELVERWKRQTDAPFATLSDKEKESDYEIAWEYIMPAMRNAVGAAYDNAFMPVMRDRKWELDQVVDICREVLRRHDFRGIENLEKTVPEIAEKVLKTP